MDLASEKKHYWVKPEHLLRVLIEQESVERCLLQGAKDVETIRVKLDAFLAKEASSSSSAPEFALATLGIAQKTILRAHQGLISDVMPAHILNMVWSETNTFAGQLLRAHGMPASLAEHQVRAFSV
jgi:ATP-dependent Clp protease ATP-binding subunit ClpA